MSKVKLDDGEYVISDMSLEAQRLVKELHQIDNRISESNNVIALLTKAKRAYISDLKSEMLSTKAGFDFSTE